MTGKQRQKDAQRKQKNAEAYYTSGNTAFEIAPVYDAPPRTNGQEFRKIRTHKRQLHSNRIHLAKTIGIVLLLFGGCMGIMATGAMLSQERIAIQQSREELSRLRNENAILSAEVAEQMDMDTIQKRAVETLGMSEPEPYQIVYINVPKESYTVQYASEKESTPSEQSLFGKLLGMAQRDETQ